MELVDALQVSSAIAANVVRVFRSSEMFVFEGSATAPMQTCRAILPGSKFSVVLLRMGMQDAMRAVFDVGWR